MDHTEETTPAGYTGWKRKTALFLAGQTASLFGTSLVAYAIIWYITLETQSGAMIALSTVCSFAPQVAVSLFAGVWADRFDRRKIIIASDALVAAATLALALLFLTGRGEMWMLFAAAGVRSLGSGLQGPAVSAMVPQIVPKEQLMRVNGIASTIQSLVMLVSPAASGALYALARMEYIFFIDVGTAAVAIGILLCLRIPPHAKAAEAQEKGYFDDLREGFAYVRRSPFVKSLLRFFALFMFFIVPAAVLTPLMVTRAFGPEVWRLTAIEMLFSLGSVLGGAVVAAWGGFKNRAATLALACALFGALTVALGFAAWFWLLLAVMLLMGLLLPFFNTACVVMLQERVEAGMQGRVFSFVNIVMTAAMPFGTFAFGPVADIVKIEALLVITGAVLAALGVWVWKDVHLRAAGNPSNA